MVAVAVVTPAVVSRVADPETQLTLCVNALRKLGRLSRALASLEEDVNQRATSLASCVRMVCLFIVIIHRKVVRFYCEILEVVEKSQLTKKGDPNSSGEVICSPYGASTDQFQSLIPPAPVVESNFDSSHQCSTFWDTL